MNKGNTQQSVISQMGLPFGKLKRMHLVGIGGAGMSAIAEILLSKGLIISGSDEKESEVTDRLKERGAKIFIGHQAAHVIGVEAVAHSSAVNPKENPETLEAYKQGIPVVKRDELLGEVMRHKVGICIAGTHGKTTTTSLTATVLHECGLKPTALIGGVSTYFREQGFGGSSLVGSGEYMVIEADEYDRTFLKLTPTIAVMTTLEAEHLDIYKDLDDLKNAFTTFAEKVPFYGSVILCADEENLLEIAKNLKHRKVTYGLKENADIRASDFNTDGVSQTFRLSIRGKDVGLISLASAGIHDTKNALAAIAVGLELGLDISSIAESLKKFVRVGRRFDVRFSGSSEFPVVIDDYAHHPTEIKATLSAARNAFPKKNIKAVFQPHLYSRTKDFAKGFAEALDLADSVALYEVFGSREKKEDYNEVSSALVLNQIQSAKGGLVTDRKAFIETCISQMRETTDVFVFMGAGDITKDAAVLAEQFIMKSGQQTAVVTEKNRISFELAAENVPLIIVPLTIHSKNKKFQLSAVLDTGATDCLISKDIAEEGEFEELLGEYLDREVHSVDGAIHIIDVVKAEQMEIGNTSRKNIHVGIMDLSSVRTFLEERGAQTAALPKAIIGYSFFKGMKLTIDYATKHLTLEHGNAALEA
ncbi:MAG: UDP-N-acetylmuramate--L-alanine ligase [Chloroherpetonaceae bacterium]|nr:UDP-N-acetylmuramate--L-alanine ligase [Chloroherpetonaceae bacterium]